MNDHPSPSRRGFLRAATSLAATAALMKSPLGYGNLFDGKTGDPFENIGVPELFVDFYDAHEYLRARVAVCPVSDAIGDAVEIVEHILQTPIEGFHTRQVCPWCNDDRMFAAPIECRVYPHLAELDLWIVFGVYADFLACVMSNGDILADDATDDDIEDWLDFNWLSGQMDNPVHMLDVTPMVGNEAELFSALDFAIRQTLLVSASVDPMRPIDSLVALESRLMDFDLRWETSRVSS